MYTADHVLLLVGGSGVTGALSTANWWESRFGSGVSREKSCRLVWTMRTSGMANFHEALQLRTLMGTRVNMDFEMRVSSQFSHLNCADEIKKSIQDDKLKGLLWVYACGPEGLLNDAEDACHKQGIRRPRDSTSGIKLSWYIAR